MLKKYILSFLFILFASYINAQSISLLQQGRPTSIRGLSVVNDQVAWVSGSNGYTAVTTDGGKNWTWQQVKGFEKADFRDIEAFSAKETIIMASGTPALILKTIDGGKSWQVKYRNTDTAYFLDAMKFADTEHGFILGDPIKGKFVLLETQNAGETWTIFANRPDALKGEAAFAASGTCLRVDVKKMRMVTGGNVSRILLYYRNSPNAVWVPGETLIKHGKASQGAFSVSDDGAVIVGGDYQDDKNTNAVAEYYYYDGARTGGGMRLSVTPPAGYQSCVERIADDVYLSTGTPGTNISADRGKTWVKIDTASYNVCRKAKAGNLVLLAGNHGRIAVLKP